MRKPVPDDEGWTFVETVISVAIVLTLSSATGVAAYRYLESARIAACRGELTAIALALESYAIDSGVYPTTEQGLDALWNPPYLYPVPEGWNGPYLSAPPGRDPWGNRYFYRRTVTGALPYELYSPGPPGASTPIEYYGEWR